jgi:hypothetical protein
MLAPPPSKFPGAVSVSSVIPTLLRLSCNVVSTKTVVIARAAALQS